ncbi:MAG: response regulator [Sulfuricurvum sp.]|jgi:YesN/AraC family two-component response regulator|uniref:response regulator n=1 Tax=Sulfuricurvum sp. TaxID=2025608 RepID=UPI0025D7539D|nr:response regulator [Sulfuricurvum sp.]MCK9372025.1 response regulator [Sulfuricurvum sp.]
MHTIKEIQALTENYTVLYVEDEAISRITMAPLLEIFFQKVYVAEDGMDGWDFFNRYPIDIIITDIRMPNMNGLEMTRLIREKFRDIPIVITTAFSDRDFFMDSIQLKVDHYLLKPITEESAKNVFHKVARTLEDRKNARELEALKVREKVSRTSHQVINQIANAYPNPCVIYGEGEVRYINEAFASLIDPIRLLTFQEYGDCLSDFFDKEEGYLHNLNEYNPHDLSKNKVSISRNKKRKIFRIIKREIEIETMDGKNWMYTFNDITWEEYQKVKIQNYSDILETFIIRKRYISCKTPMPVTAKEKALPSEKTGGERGEAAKNNFSTRMISGSENEVLRRSHTYKTTAQEYLEELDGETLQELQELHELESELELVLDELNEEKNLELLSIVATKLDIYAGKIALLFQFNDLSYAIRSLAALLFGVGFDKIDPKIFSKLYFLLVGIQQDLVYWRKNIFVDQNALDIHYLDSSFFSACLQIELILSDDITAIESSEDDFELF